MTLTWILSILLVQIHVKDSQPTEERDTTQRHTVSSQSFTTSSVKQWMKTGAGVHLMFAEVFEKLQQTCW